MSNESDATPRKLLTVEQFCDAWRFKTQAGLRSDILNAADRVNSRGVRISGNGLEEAGAIVRVGRRVLIDEAAYFKWIADQQGKRRTSAVKGTPGKRIP